MRKPDIEILSTTELINELQNRHDAFVYAGLQQENNKEIPHRYTRGWSGGVIPCQGLVTLLRRRLDEAMDSMDRLEDEDDEDEDDD